MGLSLTILGCVLYMQPYAGTPPLLGLVVAVIGVIISATGLPVWKRQ